jgi:hypothetical protein
MALILQRYSLHVVFPLDTYRAVVDAAVVAADVVVDVDADDVGGGCSTYADRRLSFGKKYPLDRCYPSHLRTSLVDR